MADAAQSGDPSPPQRSVPNANAANAAAEETEVRRVHDAPPVAQDAHSQPHQEQQQEQQPESRLQLQQQSPIEVGMGLQAVLVKGGDHHPDGVETPRVSALMGASYQGQPAPDTPWSPSHVMAPETPRDEPMVQ